VTVESEWAPVEALAAVAPGLPIRPGAETLHLVRHKGRQRTHLASAGLPQAPFALAPTREAAHAAAESFGLPVVAKRFEGSYDGYGNATCRSASGLNQVWDDLAAEDGLLIEAFVPFEAELAVTVARSASGETVVYPAVRSVHRNHRLHRATAPAGLPEIVETEARRVALAAVEAVGATGVATVELFLLPDGSVRVNEIAPRPHNTAHLTLDASHTSQFENHVRAVLGLPLGDPGLRVPAACMVNVLGQRTGEAAPDLRAALAVPGASVHLYGKTRVRPDRKMGHVTATASTLDAATGAAERAAALLTL
jgi:5-(carboxyamino)imidazole ribonucleotide synthase